MSLEFMNRARDVLWDLGLIGLDRDFCEFWLGRNESYLRTIRLSSRDASPAALATLSCKLGLQMRNTSDTKTIAGLSKLKEECDALLFDRSHIVWQPRLPKRRA
jgi:hypothetical protein